MSTSEIATVLAWHDALNARDFDTLDQLCSDDIEFGDAGGAAQGRTALRDWAQTLGDTVTVGRLYVHDGVVVAEQTVTGDDGADADTFGSAFRVVHDHVTSVFRHSSLDAALAATELTDDDLV
ncbi:nuclear transport factor 2 family protein [Mycobacterium hackensackense]|uniref:nuclear transport factor 2 family protein n=1 Tax=Mycobacterium hackensackense TaxID=228909 RepID=UPI002265BFEF|nr:nuclear transport factor 2 family protein [Mycobacterium hackensackense]MCV7252791.1 nuclear transport factor 2 family protein [Mycobacterium hackensackense]